MWQNYLKIAYKVLLRRKFFTAISLFCISFTLVVLMVVAALLDHAFAPLPPEVNAARSLRCSHMELWGPESRMTGQPGYAFLDRYLRTLPGTEAVTVFSHIGSAVSYLGDRKIVSQMRRTDAVYWRIHHFRFLEGGPFSEQDDRDRNSVAVVNAATRRRFFGDGVQALDRNVELDGQTFRIVGVVEDVPRYRETGFADVWVPIGSNRSEGYRTELMGDFEAVVLAKRRADRSRIQADFAAMLPHVEMTNPEIYKEMRGVLRTYPQARAMGMFPGRTDTMNSRFREFILAVIAGSLLFMWLPAMNLININLSRILERSSEIGVRKAFGASSWTLVGQFVLENVLLCLIGGVIALVLSALVLRGIETLGLLPYAHLRLNLRIFAIGLGLASFFGVLSGVYPAWRMSRMHPVLALRGGVS